MAKITISGPGWRKLNFLANNAAKELKNNAVGNALQAALQQEIGEIVKRTQMGVDVNGKPFKDYSSAYKDWKEGHPTGRSRKSKTRRKAGKAAVTGKVNLTLSGNMLQSMGAAVEPTDFGWRGFIYFLPQQVMKARAHQEGIGKMPQRKFFGLNREQLARVMQRIKKAIKL